MKNFKRQRTHEYRQFKTNHAYQLVGLAKRSQNWLGKLNWTCIKPWLSIKKTFQKSQKYSFSSFWRPFQNTRIGFPRVSDSEFRAASESIFRSQGGHREYGCVIVPQNLQTCRCTVLLKSKVPLKDPKKKFIVHLPVALQNKAQNQKSANVTRCRFLLPIDSYIWGGL